MNHTSSAAVHRASRRASQRRASMKQANDDTPFHTSQSSSIQSTTSETSRNSNIDELYPEVQNNNTNQKYTTNNWQRVIDPITRQSYYWNTVTGLTCMPNDLGTRSKVNMASRAHTRIINIIWDGRLNAMGYSKVLPNALRT